MAPLEKLLCPIVSKRFRLITFIPTTLEKMKSATEVNDLWDESPLEDALWSEMKRLGIEAERQKSVKTKTGKYYQLDFAIYCTNGKVNVETDGDTWHAEKTRISTDNCRNNALETLDWHVLRFNTQQVKEQMAEYCLPQIVESINRLGGLAEGKLIPRVIHLDGDSSNEQLSLF